jgi:hypothetical protein
MILRPVSLNGEILEEVCTLAVDIILQTEVKVCCTCSATMGSDDLNLCMECGEGFCDSCRPKCSCGALNV